MVSRTVKKRKVKARTRKQAARPTMAALATANLDRMLQAERAAHRATQDELARALQQLGPFHHPIPLRAPQPALSVVAQSHAQAMVAVWSMLAHLADDNGDEGWLASAKAQLAAWRARL